MADCPLPVHAEGGGVGGGGLLLQPLTLAGSQPETRSASKQGFHDPSNPNQQCVVGADHAKTEQVLLALHAVSHAAAVGVLPKRAWTPGMLELAYGIASTPLSTTH